MLEAIGALAATGEFWGTLVPMLTAGLSFTFKHVNAHLESKRRASYLASFNVLDKNQSAELKSAKNKAALLLECDEIVSQISSKNVVAYSTFFGVLFGVATYFDIGPVDDFRSNMQWGTQPADFIDPILALPLAILSTILGPKVPEVIVTRLGLRPMARKLSGEFQGGVGGYVQMRAKVERGIIEQLYRNVLSVAAPPATPSSSLPQIKNS